jgi:hypothetical protein
MVAAVQFQQDTMKVKNRIRTPRATTFSSHLTIELANGRGVERAELTTCVGVIMSAHCPSLFFAAATLTSGK